MKRKHKSTLEDVLKTPSQAGIPWKDIEGLLIALGAEITEGSGSRVRIRLNDRKAVFHRPHPRKEADKGAVASMRKFLLAAEVLDHVKL